MVETPIERQGRKTRHLQILWFDLFFKGSDRSKRNEIGLNSRPGECGMTIEMEKIDRMLSLEKGPVIREAWVLKVKGLSC